MWEGTGVARRGDVFLGAAAACALLSTELDEETELCGRDVEGGFVGENGILERVSEPEGLRFGERWTGSSLCGLVMVIFYFILHWLWRGIEVFNCLSRPHPHAKLHFVRLKVCSIDF